MSRGARRRGTTRQRYKDTKHHCELLHSEGSEQSEGQVSSHAANLVEAKRLIGHLSAVKTTCVRYIYTEYSVAHLLKIEASQSLR